MPVSGYTVRRKNYFKTEFYCGLKDLSSGDWKNRISYINSITNKKINAIKERVTMENLKILRNAVSMYNAGTGMYPENLPALIPEYISEIPNEEIMKSSNTLSVINGTGGWFYKDGWVFLNLNGKDSRGYFYSNW